jgi:predicted MFS family arabinose efflux permease
VGAGYPLAGLLAQYLGLGAPFAAGAILSAAGLVAAAVVLPPSPDRSGRLDLVGAGLLAVAVTALLITVAEGPTWGWTSGAVLTAAAAALVALSAWVGWETRAASPLVQLRLLRHRQVLSGNLTGFLVALGFYPLTSLVVRYAQTPTSAGYGLGATAVAAGALLTPFSAASFLARRPAVWLAGRASSEWVVVAAAVVLAAAQALFFFDRSGYPAVIAAMAITGAGVGGVFAVNPIQIVEGVPARETGSSLSFYQLVRTVGYSVGSALSATVLVANTPARSRLPADAAYSTAALIDLAMLACAFLTGLVLALTQPGPASR